MANKQVLVHFKTKDPVIFRVLKTVNWSEWVKPVKSDHYFEKLCENIVSQQLGDKAARAIYSRFQKLMPSGLVTPNNVLIANEQAMRDAGMSWAKVRYVKDLATQTAAGTLILERLAQMTDETVITELTKIKGIGRWTAEMFLIFSLGRENIFSFGDLGLRRGLEKVYALHNPSQVQIDKIISPWDPFKSYGSIALWHSLENHD